MNHFLVTSEIGAVYTGPIALKILNSADLGICVVTQRSSVKPEGLVAVGVGYDSYQ